MDRELFRQIWPVFSAEAREHLEGISAGILELERDPGRPVIDGVRRIAHSLKGSAGSLGLADLERLAHALEGSLAGYDPAAGLSRAAVQAALEAVEAMEAALASGDAGGVVEVPAVDALLVGLGAAARIGQGPGTAARDEATLGPTGAAAASADVLAGMDALEAALEQLCAPLEPDARRAVAGGAARGALHLAALAAPGVAALARRAADAFTLLAEGGPDAPRATAALAGDLIDLREALARAPVAPAPAEAGPTGAAAAAKARGERSIRVLASTLDSIGRQFELLALAEARRARRARDVLGHAEAVRGALQSLDHATRRLRGAGIETGRAELDSASTRLREVAAALGRVALEAQREAEAQRLAGTVLREDLRGLRMVPAALVLEPLRRAVRDVAGRLGKEVELTVEGGEVRLDRQIVDALRDPLLHLVRNAVDHGIEAPAARRDAGKPTGGRIAVRVEPRGARVAIVVEDDGPGLDVGAIRAAAVRKGLLTTEEVDRLTDAEAARLVFHAGVSTARAVTEISGRGVGMDVVLETLARLQGTIDVRWEAGRGTRFDLDVPLALSASAALVVRVGRDVVAVSADPIEHVVLLRDQDLGTVAGRTTVLVAGEHVPYAPLARLLRSEEGGGPARQAVALVLAHGGARVAVGVDELVGQQELVISSLGGLVAQIAHLAGAAVLDDGRVVGVLSAPELLRRAQPGAAAARAREGGRRVLVADDSLTTRSAMKALLELAGYAVLPAADGEEALQLLREAGADLVVSDVQMPRLDGFGLARKVKADPRLRRTPVILVTSLDAPEDRATGLAAGADGYLVKREVERGKLLDLVRQLLPRA
ncbi:response regulator [Anaeromyxobacter sp. Fw109-5]|uniref:hybrid sensor histidine kinase/response regulator n=1 Tax=Anaeromyxobacter sp. (strain Fw109-5) TaxID=404589 RepID=UPI0000ED777C|nr:response regulator [Anaeromyxobacter sp. Fw109-5]ABS24684.1 CheA signal transduction histidine kinase [Anaeromyxobacter sp. Fw109-5]